MKCNITNSLKPSPTKRHSEVVYRELNDIPRSGGCLRQKKYGLFKVSHKFLNFRGKIMNVRKLWQTSKDKTEEGASN